MTPSLTVLASTPEAQSFWIRDLKAALSQLASDVEVGPGSDGQIVFVDGTGSRWSELLESVDRRGRAVFLLLKETGEIPSALADGLVDDVLLHPFRPLEVLSKLSHYRQIMAWDEVQKLNTSFSELMNELHEDLKLAERMQKAKLPLRFPEVKGFKVQSRYLAGMRSGGDHFDLADAKDATQLSVVLSDSSSYGLSSSVLSVLMKVALKLTADESRSAGDTVRRIHDELVLTLKEKDRLSLFYGTVSRRDFKLRYLNLGTSSAFLAPAGGKFAPLPTQGDAITRASGLPTSAEAEVQLSAGDRLALVSDGFVEAVGGMEPAIALLNERREKESADTLNELVFRVKSKFTEEDDMPEQDCTAVVFDVDQRLIRLA